jgi:hypothetical protein
MGAVDGGATALILSCGLVGILFSAIQWRKIAAISLTADGNEAGFRLLADSASQAKLLEIYEAIKEGANGFLMQECTCEARRGAARRARVAAGLRRVYVNGL